MIISLPHPALADAITIITPRSDSEGAFFKGLFRDGRQPGQPGLSLPGHTLDFARSLLNAAILVFDHGLWGSIAYASGLAVVSCDSNR